MACKFMPMYLRLVSAWDGNSPLQNNCFHVTSSAPDKFMIYNFWEEGQYAWKESIEMDPLTPFVYLNAKRFTLSNIILKLSRSRFSKARSPSRSVGYHFPF